MTMLPPVGTLSCSWPALLSLLSVTVMLVGCKEEHPVTEAPTPVHVQRIEVETATEARTYTGVVRARYDSDLSFRVAGKIVERLVNVDSPRRPTPVTRTYQVRLPIEAADDAVVRGSCRRSSSVSPA